MSVFVEFKKKRWNMRKQTVLDALQPLLSKPYFTSKEVLDLGVGIAALHHYIKKGVIKRIRRGVYQSFFAEIGHFNGEIL